MLTKTTLYSALFAGLIHVLAAASPALAESGIKVTPTHLSPTIAVGDETREVVTLQNLSGEETTLRAQVDFGAGQSASMPDISIDPQEVRLGPGQLFPATISIKTPADMADGPRRVMVVFDAGPAAGGEVAIVGRVAVLVDINVIRPVKEVTWTIPHFIDSSAPASFSVRAINSGNFPTGLVENVELAGISGSVNLQSQKKQVAVGDQVLLEAFWEESPLLAVKIATLSVGSAVGAPVQEKTLVMVFPWKLCLALIAIALTAFAGGRLMPFYTKVFR